MSYRTKLLITAVASGILGWTQIIPEAINTLYKVYTGSDVFIVTSYYIFVPTIVISIVAYIIFPVITIYCLIALVRDYVKEKRDKTVSEQNTEILGTQPQDTVINSTPNFGSEPLTATRNQNEKQNISKGLILIICSFFILYLLLNKYEAFRMLVIGKSEITMSLQLLLLALIPVILIGGLIALIIWSIVSLLFKLLKK